MKGVFLLSRSGFQLMKHEGRQTWRALMIVISITSVSIWLKSASALPSRDLSFRFFRLGVSSQADTEAVSLSRDKFGNTYVVGNTYGSFGKPDKQGLAKMCIFAAKFSPSGILIWLTRTGSSQTDLAHDSVFFASVLYVTGTTKGLVALTANDKASSTGKLDGFVIAFDSFTGRRRWSWQIGAPGASTEVNAVTISTHAALFVAGHSNSLIFNDKSTLLTEDRFFIAEINKDRGFLEKGALYGARDLREQAFAVVKPVQLEWSVRNSRIELILQGEGKNSRVASVFVSITGAAFEVLRFTRLPSIGTDQFSPRFAGDVLTGNRLIAFSVAENDTLRDCAVQQISSDLSLETVPNVPIHREDLDDGSDDVCDWITINEYGIAFILGTLSYIDGRGTQIGIWIYNAARGRTIYIYRTTDELAGLEFRIAGIQLDKAGNVILAGVSISSEGMKEVLLGTFGIPKELKTQEPGTASELQLQLGSSPHKNVSNSSFIETGSTNGGFFEKGSDGKLRVPAVLVICFLVVLFILVVVVVIRCCYKRVL